MFSLLCCPQNKSLKDGDKKKKIKSCVKKKTINRVNKEWTKEPSCVGMSGYSHRPPSGPFLVAVP